MISDPLEWFRGARVRGGGRRVSAAPRRLAQRGRVRARPSAAYGIYTSILEK